jgi:hypothetical protein
MIPSPASTRSLLFTALLLGSAVAHAQDAPAEDEEFSDPFAPDPDARPMPPVRLQDEDEEQEAAEERAEEEQPERTPYTPRRRVEREPTRPKERSAPRPLYEQEAPDEDTSSQSKKPHKRGGVGITPTAGGAILLHFHDEQPNRTEKTTYSFPLWLGATLYPHLGPVSPFISAQAGFDLTVGDTQTAVEYLPTMRLGVAILDGDPAKFETQALPVFTAYLIGGARYAPGAAHETLRAGIGISSPVIAAASLYLCANGVPLPNILEYVVEIDAYTGAPLHTLMFGIGL